MTLKISALSRIEKTLDDLQVMVSGLPGAVFTAHSGGVDALTNVLHDQQPDLVYLDFPEHSDKLMKQLEDVLLSRPSAWLVLLSPDRSPDFLMKAMRAGVREVLAIPLEAMQVQQAIKRMQIHQANSGRERGQAAGRVLAMIPSKGGAGATFLATNLAYALSQHGKRVAVLDLKLYFGDSAIYLSDGVSVSNVVELASKSRQMDATLLASSMIKINNSLFVLATPDSPDHVADVTVADIEKIIELARANYDFVVLDIGNALDPLMIKALDMADSINLVLQLNLPFVRAAKRMVSVFRDLGYANDKLNLVVNRNELGGDISLADVERSCVLKVTQTIPNSHKPVSASINQGRPLMELTPRDPVALTLTAWAEKLDPTPQKKKGGWFSGWMGKSS
jgi:pilus assembly protein CpaE